MAICIAQVEAATSSATSALPPTKRKSPWKQPTAMPVHAVTAMGEHFSFSYGGVAGDRHARRVASRQRFQGRHGVRLHGVIRLGGADRCLGGSTGFTVTIRVFFV